MTDDRTKHVKHVHNLSDSQRNSDPNPSHTHQHHYERWYDYDPIRLSLGCFDSLVRVRHREPLHLYIHLKIDTLRSLDMYRLPEVWG